jgi:hypothetical protein
VVEELMAEGELGPEEQRTAEEEGLEEPVEVEQRVFCLGERGVSSLLVGGVLS